MLTPNNQRRFLLCLICFGCGIAMIKLLWDEDMSGFYAVLIGLAYFIHDRIFDKQEDSDNA